jgi:NADPH-ferrihemoprotein reductase
MGKTVNEQMAKLGARSIFEYGEGDDDCSLEDDFDAWKEKLFPALLKLYHPDGKKSEEANMASGLSIHSHSRASLAYHCNPCQKAKPQIPDAHHCNSSTRHFFTAPEVSPNYLIQPT